MTDRTLLPASVASPPTATTTRTLIDEFLAEQQRTTAAERFATWHEDAQDRIGLYRDLLPATPPGPGQQYAFEVDLDACSGCQACVVACGRLNGLPEGTSFRSTGTLVGGAGTAPPVHRTVTAACHHCVEPGCLTGCPADAYEKDPVTGVVRHLDDQCIGCQYCTLTCPYEVPAFDHDRGIVRKCDLCHDRLVGDEAPACVQACPTRAIAISVVDVEDVAGARGGSWPFPAPSPAATRPTTVYRTTEDLLTEVAAVDAGAVGPGQAHPPLTVMLVLTQLAVGTLVVLLAARWWGPAAMADAIARPAAATAVGVGMLALAASILHLGRPLQAWRAVLGLRHSWLSREIVAFGMFAPLAGATAAGLFGVPGLADLVDWSAGSAVLAGLAGIGTSVMVYAVCGRRWWSVPRVAGRFALTASLGGLVTVLTVTTITAAANQTDARSAAMWLASGLTILALAGTATELGLLRHHDGAPDDERARTARLLVRQLRLLVTVRLALLVLGGVVLPWLAVAVLTFERTSGVAAAVASVLALVSVLAAELLERWRFFTASAPARMPGRLP